MKNQRFLYPEQNNSRQAEDDPLGPLPDGLTLVFKILVDTVHYVSSQNLVEVLLVQCGHFTCELACDEVENGHI